MGRTALLSAAAALSILLVLVHAHGDVDLGMVASWTVPVSNDAHRTAMFGAAVEAAGSVACRGEPTVIVVDSGSGVIAAAASQAMPTAQVVVIVPHAPALVPVVERTLAHSGIARVERIRVVADMEAASSAVARLRGGAACVVCVDIVPSSAYLLSTQLHSLATLFAAGLIRSDAHLVPAALRPHVFALETRAASQFYETTMTTTLGVNMSAAFPMSELDCGTMWMASRPLSTTELEPWRVVVESTDLPLLHLARLAVLLLQNSLPWRTPAVTARVRSAGSVDAVGLSFDVVFDAAEQRLLRAALPGLDAGHHPHQSPVLVPVVRESQVRTNDNVALSVDVSSDLVIAAVVTAEGGRPLLRTRCNPTPPYALWHIPMLNDLRRNEAYRSGLDAVIKAGHTRILDIGAGAGLLSLLAHREGAAEIFAFEADAAMANRFHKALAANHCEGSTDSRCGITMIAAHSTAAQPVAPSAEESNVDAAGHVSSGHEGTRTAIVHEIFDHSLTGEGVLPSITDALHRHAPGATVVPARAHIWATLIASPTMALRHRPTGAAGFSLFPNLENVPLPVTLRKEPHILLTTPVKVCTIDFSDSRQLRVGRRLQRGVEAPITQNGAADAIVSWWSLDFDGSDATFGTDPSSATFAHFPQNAFILADPLNVSTPAAAIRLWCEGAAGRGGHVGVVVRAATGQVVGG